MLPFTRRLQCADVIVAQVQLVQLCESRIHGPGQRSEPVSSENQDLRGCVDGVGNSGQSLSHAADAGPMVRVPVALTDAAREHEAPQQEEDEEEDEAWHDEGCRILRHCHCLLELHKTACLRQNLPQNQERKNLLITLFVHIEQLHIFNTSYY